MMIATARSLLAVGEAVVQARVVEHFLHVTNGDALILPSDSNPMGYPLSRATAVCRASVTCSLVEVVRQPDRRTSYTYDLAD